MKSSGVNARVQRDLVSNAGSRAGDMSDFASVSAPRTSKLTGAQSPAEQFEHNKTILNNKGGYDRSGPVDQVEEDLRSIRSEYDYGSKKKFVDVLGNISIQSKLRNLRAQHEIE